MISNNFSLTGLRVEEAQANTALPPQPEDFWTMKADRFFDWLNECNDKAKLPKDFVLKPIRYDEERKCRIVTMVEN